MNSGAFGENFPYTNFHDLNLDWIIAVIKDVKNKYASIEEVSAKADEILEKIAELDNLDEEFEQLKADVEELITNVNDIVDTIYRPLSNIICLTDSYGTNDPTTNRYSWCDHLKDSLGLDSSNYLKIYQSGASFGDDDANKNLYQLFISETMNLTTARKNAVSDILIVSGINEWNESRQIMYNSMVSLNTYIRENFPNAIIWLFGVQWDKQANIRYHTMGNPSANTYNLYRQHAAELGWRYVQNLSAMVYQPSYVDDVHPNSAGSRIIMNIVKNAVYGQDVKYQSNNLLIVQIQTSQQTRNAGGMYFDGTQFIWSASPFSCDALPDLPSGFLGEIKLGTLVTTAIIGVDYENVAYPINIPCTLGINNGTWHNVPGTATIRFINGQPELWFRNNGYFETIPTPGYTNISDSYLYFGSINIPLWD